MKERFMRGQRRSPEIPKVSLLKASDVDWPSNDAEAGQRAARYLKHDPFPGIPPALLGSATFADYARVTGMVYPFKGFDHISKEFV